MLKKKASDLTIGDMIFMNVAVTITSTVAMLAVNSVINNAETRINNRKKPSKDEKEKPNVEGQAEEGVG
jgi:hypothetical protein